MSLAILSASKTSKASKGSKKKGVLYGVVFQKKIVKPWSQKIKSQDQNMKLAQIELTCYQNYLLCLGAISSAILKRWGLIFLFRI